MLTVRSVRKAYNEGRAAGAAGDKWLPWAGEPRCEHDVKLIAMRHGHELGYAEWKRNFRDTHAETYGNDKTPTVTLDPGFLEDGS